MFPKQLTAQEKTYVEVSPEATVQQQGSVDRSSPASGLGYCQNIRSGLPAQVDLDELVGASMLALVDAVRKFDPRKRTPFPTYAKHRVRGAIQDSLRPIDPLPRNMRLTHRSSERAIGNLAQKSGRAPTEEEIAKSLKLSVECWRRLSQELYQAGYRTDGLGMADKHGILVENVAALDDNPERLAACQELRRRLDEAIDMFSPRYQAVIRLYYEREVTMKKIGDMLGVNESRVSQIHGAAIRKLRSYLETDAWSSLSMDCLVGIVKLTQQKRFRT